MSSIKTSVFDSPYPVEYHDDKICFLELSRRFAVELLPSFQKASLLSECSGNLLLWEQNLHEINAYKRGVTGFAVLMIDELGIITIEAMQCRFPTTDHDSTLRLLEPQTKFAKTILDAIQKPFEKYCQLYDLNAIIFEDFCAAKNSHESSPVSMPPVIKLYDLDWLSGNEALLQGVFKGVRDEIISHAPKEMQTSSVFTTIFDGYRYKLHHIISGVVHSWHTYRNSLQAPQLAERLTDVWYTFGDQALESEERKIFMLRTGTFGNMRERENKRRSVKQERPNLKMLSRGAVLEQQDQEKVRKGERTGDDGNEYNDTIDWLFRF